MNNNTFAVCPLFPELKGLLACEPLISHLEEKVRNGEGKVNNWGDWFEIQLTPDMAELAQKCTGLIGGPKRSTIEIKTQTMYLAQLRHLDYTQESRRIHESGCPYVITRFFGDGDAILEWFGFVFD